MRAGLPDIKRTSGAAGAVRFHIEDLNEFIEARRVRQSAGEAVGVRQ